MHDVGVMSDPSLGCARPANDGVVFPDNPYGGPDLTQEPLGADSYVEFNGAENAGCLTRGPSNRTITNLEAPDGSFYVADGYAGTRVAKFDADGTFLMDFGMAGDQGRKHDRDT